MRYRWSEMRALYVMIKRIGRNKLLVADGGLFSYAALAIIMSRKSHGLFRLPACKTSRVISKRIGRRDHLQVWKRPEPRFTKFFRMLRAQPEHITVRVLTVIVRGQANPPAQATSRPFAKSSDARICIRNNGLQCCKNGSGVSLTKFQRPNQGQKNKPHKNSRAN